MKVETAKFSAQHMRYQNLLWRDIYNFDHILYITFFSIEMFFTHVLTSTLDTVIKIRWLSMWYNFAKHELTHKI